MSESHTPVLPMNPPESVAPLTARRRSPRRYLRWAVGTAICVLGALALLRQLLGLAADPSLVREAVLGGGLGALATALGALPVLAAQRIAPKVQDSLLGFGAGVMLAASAFSLILPGLAAAQAVGSLGGGPWGAGLTMALAILLGGLGLMQLDKALPHEHFIKGREGDQARQLQRVWLFVLAISLHNLPEGLAVGVGYAGQETGLGGHALAIGIAIQDLPEGLVVAVALLASGYRRTVAVAVAAASGLVEPLGALLGVMAIGQSQLLLPWGLGFAAGAMLFVISHEIIPESHRQGHERQATLGLLLGFVVMMVLDTALA